MAPPFSGMQGGPSKCKSGPVNVRPVKLRYHAASSSAAKPTAIE